SSVYGSWGQTAVQRGNQWATTSRTTNRVTGTTTRSTQTSGGGQAVTRNGPGGNNSGVVRTGSGDVYAGRDGNVYKKNDGGGWSKSDNGGWSNAQAPEQVNRDAAARAEGQQRTRDYNSTSRSSAGSSSYRPSGGGMRSAPRGGGGRRR